MTIKFVPDGDCLVADVVPKALGFVPDRIWNPSPAWDHRTEPWPAPKTIRIGISGTEETAAKFSPPPFAVGLLGGGQRALVSVTADPGYHLWNDIDFTLSVKGGLEVRLDLEGHSDPVDTGRHVRLEIIPGEPTEPLLALLARGLKQGYPDAFRSAGPVPKWWLRPIYCGWGDQVTVSMWLEGVGPEPRAIAYCTQGLYERWIRRLDQARVPAGTVTIDAGWSPTGTMRPDGDQWPDLRGFIRRQHEAGRKVLLWIATWLCDGLPDAWCTFSGGTKLTADPTNSDYRKHLRARVTELLSPAGYDADGFKIDQLAFSPSERRPIGGFQFGRTFAPKPGGTPIRLAGGGWGCELLHQLQHDIYSAAKAAKPDCLVTSSTVHPYFHDTFDMVRLHDMGAVAPDIFAAMGARANLAKAALPHKPIDTDDWVHTDYDLWMRYTCGSRAIGVPCLFYAERFMLNWQAEPATREVPPADLARIAEAWKGL